MAQPAKGLDLAVEAYTSGDLDRAARLVRRERLRATNRRDSEEIAEVDDVREQMRGHLEGDELARFDAIVASGRAPRSRAKEFDVSPTGVWLAVVGAAAVGIAVFLPEADVSALVTIDNTLIQSGDGWLLVGLAAAGAAAAYGAYRGKRRASLPLLVGALIVGLAFLDGRSSNLRFCSVIVKTACSSASPGIGLYLAGIGGAVMVIGGWQLRRASPRPSLVGAGEPVQTASPAEGEAARFCGRCGVAFGAEDSFCPGCGAARPALAR